MKEASHIVVGLKRSRENFFKNIESYLDNPMSANNDNVMSLDMAEMLIRMKGDAIGNLRIIERTARIAFHMYLIFKSGTGLKIEGEDLIFQNGGREIRLPKDYVNIAFIDEEKKILWIQK